MNCQTVEAKTKKNREQSGVEIEEGPIIMM